MMLLRGFNVYWEYYVCEYFFLFFARCQRKNSWKLFEKKRKREKRFFSVWYLSKKMSKFCQRFFQKSTHKRSKSNTILWIACQHLNQMWAKLSLVPCNFQEEKIVKNERERKRLEKVQVHANVRERECNEKKFLFLLIRSSILKRWDNYLR